jgi:NAD(P)-dependent dehydrogenase (short-subunit alcohol dehydrogenase family)
MRWTPDQLGDLTGTDAIVTGANSGIGFVEALQLARHGAGVVLAVRDTVAGDEAAARIRSAPPATGVAAVGGVRVERLDLASLESVHELAERVDHPLDLLVNNAGVMAPPRRRTTTDGFELQFGTNHLGHFALTGLLLPRLLEAPAARVTTVSSIAHHRGDGRVVDGNPEEGYDPRRSYGQSKLANLLFAVELQRRATAPGSRLTSTAAHPGVTNTRLVVSRDGMGANPLVRSLAPLVMRVAVAPPARGAEAVLYAATVAEPGSYSGPTGPGETRGAVGPSKRSRWADDETLAAVLWERSEQLTGIRLTL